MKYGPNSEQVEAYLQQVARLDADRWAAMAQVLRDSTRLLEAAARGIDTARSRATKNGLLSEVDAAARETQRSMDTTLDASPGLQGVLDRALVYAGPDDPAPRDARGAAMAALRTAATSGALLLVLRPLLADDEFSRAWPMRIIDPRSLPHHLYVPPMGAVG